MSATASSDQPPSGLVELISRAVPAGTTPTGWCHKAIHRHVLEKAPDIVDATRDAISDSFGEIPHVVVQLRADDLEVDGDSEISRALERTEGGVLLIGVGYERTEPAP